MMPSKWLALSWVAIWLWVPFRLFAPELMMIAVPIAGILGYVAGVKDHEAITRRFGR